MPRTGGRKELWRVLGNNCYIERIWWSDCNKSKLPAPTSAVHLFSHTERSKCASLLQDMGWWCDDSYQRENKTNFAIVIRTLWKQRPYRWTWDPSKGFTSCYLARVCRIHGFLGSPLSSSCPGFSVWLCPIISFCWLRYKKIKDFINIVDTYLQKPEICLLLNFNTLQEVLELA